MPAQTLGPYTLGEPLGTLPFGELIEATHAARGEPLALLILSDELVRDRRLGGLLRLEVARAAGLHHPGIARPIEVGEHDGRRYVVVERIGGTSLAKELARGRQLTPEDVSHLIWDLARALDALHQRGLVHGLLAPETIFVRDDGAAVLVGVGLLAAIDAAGLGETIGPNVNSVCVAPEQLAGRRAVASADGYALGALAYTLLIGVPPAGPADDPEQSGPTDALPPDPFAATAAVLRRQIARQPPRRYRSCSAFAAALADVLAVPLPAVAPPSPTPTSAGPETNGDEPSSAAPMPVTPGTTSEETRSARPAAQPRQAGAAASVPVPATPAMVRAMQAERQRQVRALLVVVALIAGISAVPVVLVLVAGRGADILPIAVPIVFVVGVVSSWRMWSTALSVWQGLLDDIGRAQCLQITGPVEARVTRFSRSPGYSRFTLADGRQIRVEEALHDALARRGTPLDERGLLDRLVGAEPSYDQVRIEGLTILYTPSAGLILEIREDNRWIIHQHEAYGGTTRDPDVQRSADN